MTPVPGDRTASRETARTADGGAGEAVKAVVVHDRAEIEAWARSRGVAVRQVDEDWESITYEAEAVEPDGTRARCRYRYPIPRPAALRRLARTYVVGMVHDAGRARCHHVRRVIPVGATEDELRRNAVLVASALIDLQRHERCGASVVTLTAYTVVSALEWKG
ncbi:hypothetical protein ACOQFV_12555 [Nocardiopsis changdeensis]|uniref:hypothetical protein n=1 Tax=Nocardiopsis TaxID=2013 RepID=UPI002106A169|nr:MULTISPECIES: hypothetical protein [Nocardiopsis]